MQQATAVSGRRERRVTAQWRLGDDLLVEVIDGIMLPCVRGVARAIERDLPFQAKATHHRRC
jgi:hypothetical protein